jgi:hypothetical protein
MSPPDPLRAVANVRFQSSAQAQQVDSPKIPAQSVKFVPLPPSAIAGITEHPLEGDISLAEQFVKIGFGPQILGRRGFQSTQAEEFSADPINQRTIRIWWHH